MTSRKYFLGITAMMLVLFFMFMFSEIVKSSDLEYRGNNYAKITPIVHRENERDINAVTVEFDGSSTALRDSVAAWCRYTKKNMVEENAAIIVVESKTLDAAKVNELEKKAKNGAVLIFAGFPDVSFLENSNDLKNLLGVSEIQDDALTTYGVYLYSGFLLGGEKQYLGKKEEEAKYQDFSLKVPALTLGKGTKTYVSGLIDDSGTVKEGCPALIWRAVTAKSVAFVIYDDFIDDKSIHGVLESCAYEASDFSLCPVVNAAVYTVSDFALLSEENSEILSQLYSRTSQSLVKEIIWPRLMSFSKREAIAYTCYFNTKLDKNTAMPVDANVDFFLREMREISAEAAISGNTINDTLAVKLPQDLSFFKKAEAGYDFTALYLEKLKSGDIQTILGAGSKLYALTLKEKADCDYVDAAESLVINVATQEADTYSYKDDFAYRSLATAIGYSNVLMDIKRIMRPETTLDQWQNYSEEVSGYLRDYWCKLSLFDNVTASEAAVRTSAYLSNTAACTRKGRTITITGANPGYFLLRTHGETVTNIKNASFTFIEKDAYLITITNNEAVEITVE